VRRRAIFLDRDGTLVQPRHYPSHPEELVLCERIGPPLRRLQEAGFALVVVTNQAGIARGYFGVAELDAMHRHLRRELLSGGVRLDGIYFCPHHRDGVVPELAVECECRKPRPGMILQAASELGLSLRGSWLVGDILDDVEAGNRAGCRTVLVDLGTEFRPESPRRAPHYVARDTPHALAIVEADEGLCPAAERDYVPRAWREQSPALRLGA